MPCRFNNQFLLETKAVRLYNYNRTALVFAQIAFSGCAQHLVFEALICQALSVTTRHSLMLC